MINFSDTPGQSAETKRFLEQFAAARKNVANWPQWVQKLIVKAKP